PYFLRVGMHRMTSRIRVAMQAKRYCRPGVYSRSLSLAFWFCAWAGAGDSQQQQATRKGATQRRSRRNIGVNRVSPARGRTKLVACSRCGPESELSTGAAERGPCPRPPRPFFSVLAFLLVLLGRRGLLRLLLRRLAIQDNLNRHADEHQAAARPVQQ